MKKLLYIFIILCFLASCSRKVNQGAQRHPPEKDLVEKVDSKNRYNGEKGKTKTKHDTWTKKLKKRTEEFRGVWIPTAWQERYQTMTTKQCQDYLTNLVETLHKTGFNTIIFQVRPEGDAFYKSEHEPWSRFLTGTQGKAPEPLWDPMEFMINLCHERGIEFHAWFNPYRMWMSKAKRVLANSHVYHKHPEWFVTYDGQLYLNPGLPECRGFIRTIVSDIVSRYDVDAIHIDDYFYPYPVAGMTFNDNAAFKTYAPQLKIDMKDKDALGNFRCRNVDILIKYIHEDIQRIKPDVRFGISPFGIYRNKATWAGGSNTNGAQSYDDLYADVLFWAKSGWIDYIVPQLYWEIGNKSADYSTLVKWWDENVPEGCELYIGQSIERSLDGSPNNKRTPPLTKSHKQFTQKLQEAATAKNVKGNCFWYSYQIEDNFFKVNDFLTELWKK